MDEPAVGLRPPTPAPPPPARTHPRVVAGLTDLGTHVLGEVLDLVDSGVVIMDDGLRCRQVSRWAAARVGRRPDDLVGREAAAVLAELLGDSAGGRMLAACRAVLHTGQPARYATEPVTAGHAATDPGDGRADADVAAVRLAAPPAGDTFVDWTVRRLADPVSGRPLGAFLSFVDVTTHVRAARAEAARAERDAAIPERPVAGAPAAASTRDPADPGGVGRQASLAAEPAWLEAALRDAPVGVLLAEAPSGRVLRTNAVMDRIVAGSRGPDAAVDHAGWVAFHPDGRALAPAEYPLARVLATGLPVAAEEHLFRRADGSAVWVRTRAAPVFGAAGALVGAVVVAVGIDAERAVACERERLLAASERSRADAERAVTRLQTLHALTSALSTLIEREAVAALVVERVAPLFGAASSALLVVDGDSLVNLGATGFAPPDVPPALRYPIALGTPGGRVVRTGEPVFLGDIAAWEADFGRWAPWMRERGLHASAAVPVRSGDEVIGVLAFNFREPRTFAPDERTAMLAFAQQAGIALDRTRLFAAERNARAEAEIARDNLARVIAEAPVAVAVVAGAEHVFVSANDRYRALVGGRDVIGRTVREIRPELVEQGLVARIDRAYATGEPFVGRAVPTRIDVTGTGRLEDFYFDITYQPLAGAGGRPQAVAVVAADVTAHVQAERAAAAARAAAEESARVRDEVLAIVSHDLGTPLSAIAMAARALVSGAPGDPAEIAATITRCSEWALRFIRDLVDVAAIEGGGLTVHREPMTVSAILESITELFEGRARAGGVELVVGQRDAPRWIDADVDRLVQAVGNLVSNAIRFTPDGGRVSVTVIGAADGAVRFEVADSGAGIPAEHLPHVFDRFWQARASRRGGAGLGLAIARGIAEGHGGHVEVTSAVGQGSVFALVLPASP